MVCSWGRLGPSHPTAAKRFGPTAVTPQSCRQEHLRHLVHLGRLRQVEGGRDIRGHPFVPLPYPRRLRGLTHRAHAAPGAGAGGARRQRPRAAPNPDSTRGLRATHGGRERRAGVGRSGSSQGPSGGSALCKARYGQRGPWMAELGSSWRACPIGPTLVDIPMDDPPYLTSPIHPRTPTVHSMCRWVRPVAGRADGRVARKPADRPASRTLMRSVGKSLAHACQFAQIQTLRQGGKYQEVSATRAGRRTALACALITTCNDNQFATSVD